MTLSRNPVPLRQSLEYLLAGLGAPKIDSVTKLMDSWPEVVGPKLATKVKAVSVKGSELVVRVEDPAWASQIAWLESQLLQRIATLIGPDRITTVTARVVRQ